MAKLDIQLEHNLQCELYLSRRRRRRSALGGRPRYRGTGDYLGLEYTPMTSLRDIAEGIPFYVLPEKRRS